MSLRERIKPRKIMDGFKAYIPYIERKGMDGKILSQIIAEHAPVREYIEHFQARYDTDKADIYERPVNQLTLENVRVQRLDIQVNNKIANPMDDYAISTKVGYVLGHPINYVVDKKLSSYQRLSEAYEDLITRVNMADKDMMLGTQTSVAGYGARLVYWSEENGKAVLRIANVNPAECIFLYDETLAAPRYAIQYYSEVEINDEGARKQVNVAEFHDEVNTYFYRAERSTYEQVKVLPHYLKGSPLFGAENNDDLHSETYKALSLMAAYDQVLSDAVNEVEATRLAMMVLRNIGMDDEDIQAMKEAGLLELWGPDTDVKFLTKDVNNSMIEHTLDRIDSNITKFLKSVDFTDEAFGGNISGIAMKFKTLNLEWKAVRFEQKLRSTLTYQSKLLCAGWSILGICSPEDYLKIWYAFKRNMPANVKEEAEITEKLQGRVSERTRLSLLSFVDDVDAELEMMKQEQLEHGNNLPNLDDDFGKDDETDVKDDV